MALITCPDCGKQFSSYAVACPFCGRPRNTIVVLGKTAEANTPAEIVRVSHERRRSVAKGNRLARAGLVFSILCMVCGSICWKLSFATTIHVHISRRGSIVMAVITTLFFFLAQPLSCGGFFRRLLNKGGASGMAITGIALSTVGELMALFSLLHLPSVLTFV